MTEHEHEYVSECCEALPIGGELDLTPQDGIIGVCQECRDPAPFVCIQCEEEDDNTGD